MRIEVFYRDNGIDGRALRLKRQLKDLVSSSINDVAIVDVYLTDFSELDKDVAIEIFSDKVAQRVKIDEFVADSDFFPNWRYAVEISYKVGVTDPIAITSRTAIETACDTKLDRSIVVQTARLFLIDSENLSEDLIKKLNGFLHNELIQRESFITKDEWLQGKRFPKIYNSKVAESCIEIDNIDLESFSGDDLVNLSKKRLLALTLEEMEAVKSYYKREDIKKRRESLGMNNSLATDVELEMIAQTWSEHCKHKILSASVTYKNGESVEEISSLFKEYIKDTTDIIAKDKDYLRSLFHDNSGIIQFDDDHCICYKVETHNSPSALDPYGGAITGIVGVNRDIIGSGKGARPIWNTNMLCFGDPETPDEEIPEGLLHPRQVISGVHHGIIDGGNQSGIPVVGGMFVFDDSYKGKPLVFCGTGGILPTEVAGEGSWIKHINAGDKVVMVGGRIGKDGIHGATFSSLQLDEESPTSAVQIGDPITQKKFSDFIIEARDKSLYKGITDNGAGGLSSSLGEMAEDSNGIKIELDKCPLKYKGLAPWEILVSESQERMSLSVSDETLDDFMALAKSHDVEATVIGEFTDSGFIEILYDGKVVGDLELDFLHNGLPKMHLQAEWIEPNREKKNIGDADCSKDLLALLSDSTIASKEPFVRQYDHEVQAQSVIKPFIGVNSDAPSDGAVLKPVATSNKGVTVTCGLTQRYSDIDTYSMAANGVDEAMRAHIALGGDPDLVSALDNFCWPDPVESETTPDGKYKMAQLVRACKGLKDTCIAYKMPLISGKDSMKNDSQLGGKKVSVRPTLLISVMGIIKNIKNAQTTDFKTENELIYLLGETKGELGGTSYEKIKNIEFQEVPKVDTTTAMNLYRKLNKAITNGLTSSVHDLSDGGLAVALAESAIGGDCGFEVCLNKIKESQNMESARLLFCESASRFIVSVKPENQNSFEEAMQGTHTQLIGQTNSTKKIIFTRNDDKIIDLNLSQVIKAWKKFEK